MRAELIAPCGINCAVCAQYQRKKNPCAGCRQRSTRKSELCVMKNCRRESRTNPLSCAGCRELPCRRLRSFDERYRRISEGRLSVIENLRCLEREGMDRFLERERKKWTCPICGALLCVGSPLCPGCGRPVSDGQNTENEEDKT